MFCREIKGRQSKKYNLCIYTDILICDTFFQIYTSIQNYFLSAYFCLLYCRYKRCIGDVSFSFPLCDNIFISPLPSFLKGFSPLLDIEFQVDSFFFLLSIFQDVFGLFSDLHAFCQEATRQSNDYSLVHSPSFFSCCFQTLLCIFRFQQFETKCSYIVMPGVTKNIKL